MSMCFLPHCLPRRGAAPFSISTASVPVSVCHRINAARRRLGFSPPPRCSLSPWPPSFLTGLRSQAGPLQLRLHTAASDPISNLWSSRCPSAPTPLRGSHYSGIRPKLPDWSGSADLGSSLSSYLSVRESTLCRSRCSLGGMPSPALTQPPAALDFSISWLRGRSRIPGPCPDSTDKCHLLLQLLVKASFLPLMPQALILFVPVFSIT